MILRSLLWLAREVQQAAEAERRLGKEQVLEQLRHHMARLERGEIDEETYERLEEELLDLLEDGDDEDPDPETDSSRA